MPTIALTVFLLALGAFGIGLGHLIPSRVPIIGGVILCGVSVVLALIMVVGSG